MNIYIHIPFCNQKCSYCKFALTPIFTEYKKQKYLSFLEKEITEKIKKFNIQSVETIYFGGGTPSILKPEEVKKILDLFPSGNKEISFECNPEDITIPYLESIFSLGINRISIGIQSLNQKSLQSTERQGVDSIFSALKSLQSFQVGNFILFGNQEISVNFDMILGLPYEKKGEIKESIEFLHKNFPFITHTSIYILEKGIYPKNWQKNSLSDEEINEEFLEICEYFHKKGWNHYEFSNFAKPKYECKHNLGYWNHTENLGFGLSASEFFYKNNQYFRATNSPSFSGYYKGEKFQESLNREQIELEKLMFGLRTNGYSPNPKIPLIDKEKLEKFLKEGLLEGNHQHFSLSRRGFLLIDFITEELLK